MPRTQAVRTRTGSRRTVAAAATLAVGALLGVTLQTTVAQPAEASAAVTAAAKTAASTVRVSSATIGGSKYAVRGTNVQRGVDQLIHFKAPAKKTTTNEWGVEVTVRAGKVTAVNDREKSRSTTKTTVPAGAYVLSGHGKAAEWLRARARKGVKVTLGGTKVSTTPTKPTTPKPTTSKPATSNASAPKGLPTKVQAVYHMMWSNSGSPRLANIPKQVNVVNLAFMQGSTPKIVGWGSQSKASFVADAKALRARGVRIVASVGGAGGHLNVKNRTAFVNGVMALNKELPLDGLDWDIEGSTPMPPADIVAISKSLKQKRGSKFAITLAPNGSNIDHYRGIAVQLQRAGALDMIGQQFYDAVVSKEAAKMRVAQLVTAGIPQNKVAVGMMVGPQSTYWTVGECITAVKYIKASYPRIRGGYLWEAGRAGTADWATRLSPVLKG
jgi:hypothetical protein